MYGSTFLSVKLSIAILSGFGFVGILILAPVTAPNYKQKIFHEKNDILPLKQIEKDRTQMVYAQTKKEKESFFLNLPSRSNSQNNSKQTEDLEQGIDSQFKAIEMNYQINSNFSASFKSSRFDMFDDRFKQYPTSMAGISVTGNKYISAGFVAGESTLDNPYRYNNGGFLNGNNFSRDTESLFRDIDRVNKNLFELQANFSPSQNLMFQTLIYNSNRSYINETNVSEGTRVAMAVGLRHVILNIRYNYMSDNLMRTIFRSESASTFNKDYATIGFTFFFDRYKKYSIYLGHNYYNITAQNRPSDSMTSIPANNSFSASFRGRSSDYYNSSFFFNFKNNTNRDYYYSSFGVFRLPIASHLVSEYATSLGLELSF